MAYRLLLLEMGYKVEFETNILIYSIDILISPDIIIDITGTKNSKPENDNLDNIN
jgi:hypothetical protein